MKILPKASNILTMAFLFVITPTLVSIYSHIILSIHFNVDWVGCLGDWWSSSGFPIFLVWNLISYFSRKQCIVSCASTQYEYQSTVCDTTKLTWILTFISELGVEIHVPSHYCVIYRCHLSISKLIFHSPTKNVEIDFHFVQENVCPCDSKI